MLFEDIWWIYWLSDYISMYNKWDEFPEEYGDLEEFREAMEEHYNLDEIFSDFKFSNPKTILKYLKNQFDYLWHSWDEENYICFELVSDKYKTFTLK